MANMLTFSDILSAPMQGVVDSITTLTRAQLENNRKMWGFGCRNVDGQVDLYVPLADSYVAFNSENKPRLVTVPRMLQANANDVTLDDCTMSFQMSLDGLRKDVLTGQVQTSASLVDSQQTSRTKGAIRMTVSLKNKDVPIAPYVQTLASEYLVKEFANVETVPATRTALEDTCIVYRYVVERIRQALDAIADDATRQQFAQMYRPNLNEVDAAFVTAIAAYNAADSNWDPFGVVEKQLFMMGYSFSELKDIRNDDTLKLTSHVLDVYPDLDTSQN